MTTRAAAIAMTFCTACASMVKPRPGEGITNALHGANVGKIVFSKTLISREAPDAAQLTETFGESDRIYGRAYLEKSFENHVITAFPDSGYSSDYYVVLYIDGKLGIPSRADDPAWGADYCRKEPWQCEMWFGESLGAEELTQSTRQIWINTAEEPNHIESWSKIVNALPAGKHRVRLEMWTRSYIGKSEKPAAVGEFTLEKAEGAVVRLGRTFADLKPGMTSADIEQAALAAVAAHASEQGWKERFEKVKIQSSAWSMIRHEVTGVLLGRQIGVWAFARWPDGHCTHQPFTLGQEHDGKDFSGPLRYVSIGSQTEIDCD